MSKRSTGDIAWSSDGAPTCPGCGRTPARCRCPTPPAARPTDGVVRVGRQTKGRKGAGVTVVTGLPLDAGGLRELARELKAACDSGGTVKDGAIEIQGDHRDRIVDVLSGRGFRAKRAGG